MCLDGHSTPGRAWFGVVWLCLVWSYEDCHYKEVTFNPTRPVGLGFMTGTNLAQDLKGTSLLCAVVWCVDSMVELVFVLVAESNPRVRISGLEFGV